MNLYFRAFAGILLIGIFQNIGARTTQDSLELIEVFATVPKKNQKIEFLPLFLAAPDSICGVKVSQFIWGDDDQAENLLAKSGNLCGTNLESNNGLQILFYLRFINQRKFEKAHKLYLLLVKQKLPELIHYSVQLNWSVASYFAGAGDKAKEILNTLKTQYPRQDGVWKNLFSLYIGMGDYQKADELVETIMDTLPSKIWAQESKINLIDMLGTQSDLIEYLKKKSSWRDSLFAIQIAYASLLKKKKHNKLAIQYYTRGLEGNPQNGEGWLELAELFFEENQRDLTFTSMQNAIRAGIDNPTYFILLNKLVRMRVLENFRLQDIKMKDRDKCIQTWRPGACQEMMDKYIKEVVDENFHDFTKIIEDAFTQTTFIRPLAQTLEILYLSTGRKKAANRLKSQFWFHFESPFPTYYPLGAFVLPYKNKAKLNLELGYVTLPLLLNSRNNDWFPMPWE